MTTPSPTRPPIRPNAPLSQQPQQLMGPPLQPQQLMAPPQQQAQQLMGAPNPQLQQLMAPPQLQQLMGPPQLQQLMAPPQQPQLQQLMAPPQQQPQPQLMVPTPQQQLQQQLQQLMAPTPQQQQLQQYQHQLMAPPQGGNQPHMVLGDTMHVPTPPSLRPPVSAAPKSQRLMRPERHMFATSDDTVMMKQILATHAHDGREVDVKPLLALIDEILQRSATTTLEGALNHQGSHMAMDSLDEKTQQAAFVMLEALAYTIHKISCEISCKCSGGGDAHTSTVALFNTLSSYPWDAKVVLALAAFAVTYGEFWLVAELYSSHPLAKSIALLKQLPDIYEYSETLRPRFEALTSLIRAMLEVAKCVVQFTELPLAYISPDQPPFSVASTHIPTAVYWTIRSAVACASQIIGLIGLGHEYIPSTTEAWELSSLAHKVNNIRDHLLKQLALCYQYIDEKKQAEAYENLVQLFIMNHIDNMKIMKALFCPRDDIQPLLEGTTKKRVGIEVLRRKSVLLLISDLDISQEELDILDQMYREARPDQPTRPDSQYEVVWLPVVDRTVPWTEVKHKDFLALQSKMPWYSVVHPNMVDLAVIKYIKEVWRFNKKPILVVLDAQGRVVSPNALYMMWIWGTVAFPFTSAREEALWSQESWRLELLVDSIDPRIFNWIAEERCICLYGGEDMDWIRKFTKAARGVAQIAGIPLEMVYVGKSSPKERVRKNIGVITSENLSGCWPDLSSIWFFWVRLESMWHSKMQQGKTVKDDYIMQEIMNMLTFDGSEQGWALISKGSDNMAKGKGDTMLLCFENFEKWKDNVDQMGFVPAINTQLQDQHTPHHCSRLILPGTVGTIPEMVVCAECGRIMEKFVMYRCCTD